MSRRRCVETDRQRPAIALRAIEAGERDIVIVEAIARLTRPPSG
jgi:hypothetical protein